MFSTSSLPQAVASAYDRRTNPSQSRSRIRYGAVRTLARGAALLAARSSHLPARTLLALLWVYQRTLSPALPVVFGSACGCRFAPTCSHYAAEAVRTHGALAGTFLAMRRLLKCTPLHPGGFDPVPRSLRARLMCRRAAPQSICFPGAQRGAASTSPTSTS